MALHVNVNLALRSLADDARRAGACSTIDPRAQLAAQFIPSGSRVLDLGCGGGETLHDLMPLGCGYQAVDRIAHGKGSLIGDLVGNLAGSEFPTHAATQSDIIVMLGTLEKVADVESLFTHLRFCKQDVILSYCPTDLVSGRDREALSFANHLSYFELVQLFDRYGFRVECTAPLGEREMLMRLTPTERVAPVTACDVAVVSDSDGGTFGDRLGLHMINAMLPGAANVHHLTFKTLAHARDQYDLVVLGVGNCLFQPLLGDDILNILSRAKSAIGIFGTQYRELIPRPAIDRVIDRLDTWYAPYQDDVLMYGRGRSNAVHLGDWLIDQFPLTEATLDEPLQIGVEIGDDIPLDRTIQAIQRHKQVYSARLHPLLCALTSAHLAAYAEEPSGRMPGIVSGKFRSMLIDIFGRTYPEREFFMVDRDAVMRYKARVHGNVAKVAERIEAMLRNVAVAN
ncbi:MAG: methyltransferase domain-containing protein [Pseudolabrys sp.]|nr:methyltransferase domain-containing protein [Pseudolabrys sp.]MDP2298278.1 methyltransferase domain-containing protein [Pseudolabrys sp.]